MPYLGQRPSKGDENNFKILDDISSYTLTFDGSDSSVVSAANDTITSLTHRFVQGQRVTYNKGSGGTVITGLTDGVYYIIKEDHNTIKLATSASNASNGVAVNITGVGAGSSHTLNVAFDGINTKFKATHTNGQKAKITRSAQLVISINGVIQQPHDSATPSTGFGFDLDGTIVLSQAPVAGDIYWAHVLTNNNVTFDISDNDVDNFTGNGSTVSFNLSKTPPDNRNVLVTIDGVVQYPNDPDGTVRAYNVVENVLTFTTAPDANVEIQVRHIGFAGSTSGGGGSGVTNFYGRTGSVVLTNSDNITVNNAAVTGDLTVTGDMTVNGDFTTLNTTLREVELLHVDANSSEPAGIITQRGSGDILNLYDGSTEVFSVADGGLVEVKARAADTKRVVLAGSPTNTTFQLAAYDGATGTGAGTTQARFGLFYNADENAVLKFERGTGAPDGALTINTNNTEQLRFLSNGDIRASWNDKFIGMYHSADYYMGATFEATGNTNRALFIDNRAANGRGDIIFRTGVNQDPVERLTIKGTGNIGIGTNNPDHNLHIYKYGGDAVITIESTGNGNHSALEFFRTTSTGDSKGAGSIYVTGDTSATEAKMQFGVGHNVGHGQLPRMTIMGNGEVGIGTDNPQTELEIHGNSGGTIRLAKGGTNRTSVVAGDTLGKIQFRSYDASLNYNSYSGTYAEIETVVTNDLGGNPSEEVRLDLKIADSDEPGSGKVITPVPALSILQGGKVGIGTNAPASKLHIHNPTTSATQILECSNGSVELALKHTNGYGSVNTYYQGTATWRIGQTGQFNDFSIWQASGVGSGQTPYRFAIKNSGNVGISTYEPREILHVNKNSGTACILVSSSTAPQIRFNPNATDTTDNDRSILGQATGSNNFISGAVAGDTVLRGNSTGNILFGIATSEKLRIKSDGKVGIGENSPDSLLHIKGNDTAYSGNISVGPVLNLEDSQGRVAQFIAPGSAGDASIGTKTNHHFNIMTGNSSRIFINNNDGSTSFYGDVTSVDTTSGSTVTRTLKVGASAASGTNNGTIIINNGGLGNASLQFDYENSAARAKIYTYRSTNDIIFDTSGAEKFRILNSGQLRGQGTYNGSSSTSNDFPCINISNLQGSYTANNIISGITFGKVAGHTNGIRAGILALYSDTGSQNGNVGTDLVFRTANESAGDSNEKLRINAAGGLKLSNTAGGSLFEYGGSTVQSTAAININRYGNGYADIRLSSNYGAAIKFAGAGNNTDEYSIQQDNQKNAYHNLEYDGFIQFVTNNNELACRMQDGKVSINKNLETLTGNGFNAALQVSNKTTDGYGTIMMGGGYNRGTIGIGNVYDLILTSNAYPANASTGGIKFRCGTSGGGGPHERMRIHQDGMLEVRQNGGSKTYWFSSSKSGVYSTLVVQFDGHNYHSFAIDISVMGYAYKWGSARYLGYCNSGLYGPDNGPFETTSGNAITMAHSHVSNNIHKVTCGLDSMTHPACEFRITIGGPDAYIDTGDISFTWS